MNCPSCGALATIYGLANDVHPASFRCTASMSAHGCYDFFFSADELPAAQRAVADRECQASAAASRANARRFGSAAAVLQHPAGARKDEGPGPRNP